MKNKQELAKYFAQLGFTRGAEIGVCRGYFSKTICESIPNLTLYGIDNWGEVIDRRHKNRNNNDAYKMTLENLKPYIESGRYIIIRKTSMDALADIPDGSLDFVFIDADHRYDWVKRDVEEWSKKVRIGGIVSGHDYYESTPGKYVGRNAYYALGIIKAVDECVQKTGYQLHIIGWDRGNPDKDSRPPCWYFIKDTSIALDRTV